MGYRMFVEDDMVNAKPTAISDPTASARSSIRRQRTVRHSPSARSAQSSSLSLENRRRSHSIGRSRPPPDRRSLLQDIRRRDGASERHASSPQTLGEIVHLESILGRHDPSVSQAADAAHAEATNRSRMESGRARLRDALSHELHAAQLRGADFPEHTSTDSRATLSLAEGHSSERSMIRRPPPPRYTSTPPYTSARSLDESPLGFSGPSLGMVEYTPGFPPANLPAERLNSAQRSSRISERMTNLARLSNQIRNLRATPRFRNEPALEMLLSDVNFRIARNSTDLSTEDLTTETGYVDNLTRHLELLARSGQDHRGNRAIAPPLLSQLADQTIAGRLHHPESQPNRLGQADEVDGLGDRARSLSPDVVSWEILHNNITPDERIPSTNSSFSSASTSESAISRGTNSGTTSSYGTSFTSPSTTAEAEPCPAIEISNSDNESHGDGLAEEVANRSLNLHERASEVISQSDNHLHRIESLSRRLNQQRSRSEYVARHRRMVERETELQRMEATLQALERQIEEERHNAAEWQRLNGTRAGRERL